MWFPLLNKLSSDDLSPVSYEEVFLGEYFLFINIKSIQEPVPLKLVLFFMRLTKFWLSMNENMLGLEGSRLKSPITTLLSYSFRLEIQQMA